MNHEPHNLIRAGFDTIHTDLRIHLKAHAKVSSVEVSSNSKLKPRITILSSPVCWFLNLTYLANVILYDRANSPVIQKAAKILNIMLMPVVQALVIVKNPYFWCYLIASKVSHFKIMHAI